MEVTIPQDPAPTVTETRYRCRWGWVIKRHHPAGCICGCTGGQGTHVKGWGWATEEVWMVKLDGRFPFNSTPGASRFGSEAKANRKVAQLMRDGAGSSQDIDKSLTWTTLQAEESRSGVLTGFGFESRVQVSKDERLVKVKLRQGALWRITVYDAFTLDVLTDDSGNNERYVWDRICRDLHALGWGS